MYKLTAFIPDENLEAVKNAVFAAGAGKVGNYSHCCWQALGQGQFKPLSGSKPHIGHQNKIETVAEWRVEFVVADDCCIHTVVQALKDSHPYETPAYDVVKVEDL